MKPALTHLAEEGGELVQAAIKVYRYGKTPQALKRLTEEAGDVMALIDTLVKAGMIDKDCLKKRRVFKRDRYSRYLKGNK